MELFFREYGEGKPLIILHGVLGLSDNWVTFARKIAEEGFRVLIPDQRNHGQSPHHDTFNYYALVDDLVEFIDAHQIEDPVIMGHSMGGKVAMRYALENPDAIDKLIVVDTSMRTYTRHNYHRQLIDAMLNIDFNMIESRTDVEKELEKTINSERIRQFLLKNLYWNDNEELAWRPNFEVIGESLEEMYDGVFYSTRFEKPVLFVKGGKSEYILPEDLRNIRENFPNATLETIEDGTHWVHADDPEKFYEIVREFLLGDE